jgi:signal transduction histidine kinase
VRQVLTNLLSNAVQHGDPDSPVVFEVSGDGNDVCCEVRNLGPAIPPDALQVIFDPLVQVPKDVAEGHSNSDTSLGLGLYIAREIVAAHGGTIGVTSSSAEGTAFKVRLPSSTPASA